MSVQCVKCGETDCMRVNLDDFTTLTCSNCDEETTLEEIKEVMSQWAAMVKKLESLAKGE